MQSLKQVQIFSHVQFMFLNGAKVIVEISMANVQLSSLYKTIRVKHSKPENMTDYRNPFYINEDKQKNREIMDGDWIFSNKGVDSSELEKETKKMYTELLTKGANSKVAVRKQDQAEFLKKCGIPVFVYSNIPETVDLVYSTKDYEPPKRKHTCRSKRIYCAQTDAWIIARYIQNVLKAKNIKRSQRSLKR